MTGSQLDGAWSETCLIGITAVGGTSNMAFQAITETVDIDTGDKDFDVIATLSGGRLVKFNPQEHTTITFEAYPLQAGTKSGSTGTGFFGMKDTEDTSDPLDVDVDNTRTKHRVAILWTDNSSSTTAEGEVGTNYAGLRVVAANGYFTSVKPSMTDGVLKFTVAYKVPPFNSSGTANIAVQSTIVTGATLTALSSYTTTVNW